jgi:hypothetical protein
MAQTVSGLVGIDRHVQDIAGMRCEVSFDWRFLDFNVFLKIRVIFA